MKGKLDGILLPWTQQEIICRDYMKVSKDDLLFDKFKREVKKKCMDLILSLPGITDIEMPRPSIIYDFFENDVFVIRHGRYDIPFKHKHTFYEIIYVYQGKANNITAGMDCLLEENELIIIPPNVEHSLFTTGVVINILVKKHFIKNIFLQFTPVLNTFSRFMFDSVYAKEQKNYIKINVSQDVKLLVLFYTLFEESLTQKNNISDMLMQCILFLLCRDFGEEAQTSEKSNVTNELIIDILHYIYDNCKDVTLQYIAQKFNYSVPYLSKIISDSVNQTFKEILYKTRIDKALQMLSSLDDPIEKVSEELGYKNTASFYRAFKKVIGMTPNKYRENCRNSNYLLKI